MPISPLAATQLPHGKHAALRLYIGHTLPSTPLLHDAAHPPQHEILQHALPPVLFPCDERRVENDRWLRGREAQRRRLWRQRARPPPGAGEASGVLPSTGVKCPSAGGGAGEYTGRLYRSFSALREIKNVR